MADIHSLQLVVDAKNRLSGSGQIHLGKPFDYQGQLQASLSDCARRQLERQRSNG
jgi:hypothetical protein